MTYNPIYEHRANTHWNRGYAVATGVLEECFAKPLAYEENHMVEYLQGYAAAKRDLLTKLLEGKIS